MVVFLAYLIVLLSARDVPIFLIFLRHPAHYFFLSSRCIVFSCHPGRMKFDPGSRLIMCLCKRTNGFFITWIPGYTSCPRNDKSEKIGGTTHYFSLAHGFILCERIFGQETKGKRCCRMMKISKNGRNLERVKRLAA